MVYGNFFAFSMIHLNSRHERRTHTHTYTSTYLFISGAQCHTHMYRERDFVGRARTGVGEWKHPVKKFDKLIFILFFDKVERYLTVHLLCKKLTICCMMMTRC